MVTQETAFSFWIAWAIGRFLSLLFRRSMWRRIWVYWLHFHMVPFRFCTCKHFHTHLVSEHAQIFHIIQFNCTLFSKTFLLYCLFLKTSQFGLVYSYKVRKVSKKKWPNQNKFPAVGNNIYLTQLKTQNKVWVDYRKLLSVVKLIDENGWAYEPGGWVHF